MSVSTTTLSFEDQLIQKIKELDEAKRIDFIRQEELYIKKINDNGELLLHFAAKHGHIDIAELLIDAGSNVNEQDNFGKTPIIAVVENKPQNYVHIIEILFKADAHIFVTDNSGKNAAQLVLDDAGFYKNCLLKFYLHLVYFECKNNDHLTAQTLVNMGYSISEAVVLGNLSVIKHMITLGCDINDYNDDHPILAVSTAIQCMDLEIFNFLINSNAAIDTKDSNGLLPIAYYGSYIKGKYQQPEIIKVLLNKSLILRNVGQKTTLHQFRTAFENGNKEVIQMLVDYHENMLSIRNSEGLTVLHYLAINQDPDITEVLQDRKIDVNVIDKAGRTPLFLATYRPCAPLNTFKFLLKKNANVNATTSSIIGSQVPLFSLSQNISIKKEIYFKILEMFLEFDLDVQYIGLNNITVFDIIMKNNTSYMAEPILRHLAIIDESKRLVDFIRDKIYSIEIFKKYFDNCKYELLRMKNAIINDKLTLNIIVTRQITDEQILKKCRLGSDSLIILEKLKEEFFQNNFYYDTVQKRITCIVSKLILWRKAVFSLCEIFKFTNSPYHIVITEISDYLDEKDLNNLLKVTL